MYWVIKIKFLGLTGVEGEIEKMNRKEVAMNKNVVEN